MSELSLKEYRATIRSAWLPLKGRKQLSSRETKLINAWYGHEPLENILQAIAAVAERSTDQGFPLTSLGIIASDLAAIRRRQARMRVGQSVPVDDWRASYDEYLADIASITTNPEEAAMYNELRGQLAGLTKEEADKRWKQIAQK